MLIGRRGLLTRLGDRSKRYLAVVASVAVVEDAVDALRMAAMKP